MEGNTWTKHFGAGGKPYWYNHITRESTWEDPTMIQEASHGKKKKKKIEGTNWLFVTTADGLEFYYNRETKTSVWEKPEEVQEAQDRLKEMKAKTAAVTEREEKPDHALEEEQNAKRPKVDRSTEDVQEVVSGDEEADFGAMDQEEAEAEATEMTEEDIAWQLQQMSPQELSEHGFDHQSEVEDREDANEQEQAAKEDEEHNLQESTDIPESRSGEIIQEAPHDEPRENTDLSQDERVEIFMQMLSEKDVSPYSTWENELSKFISDERTLLVPQQKRKTLFNNYCRLKSEELRISKANKKTPEEEFMGLLEETIKGRMYWEDFRRRAKNDKRFKAIFNPKEREKMFKDYIKNLK